MNKMKTTTTAKSNNNVDEIKTKNDESKFISLLFILNIIIDMSSHLIYCRCYASSVFTFFLLCVWFSFRWIFCIQIRFCAFSCFTYLINTNNSEKQWTTTTTKNTQIYKFMVWPYKKKINKKSHIGNNHIEKKNKETWKDTQTEHDKRSETKIKIL